MTEPDEIVIQPETNLSAENLKERISTLLSMAAMLAISGGLGWGLWPRFGPFSLIFAGALLAAMVGVSDAGRRPGPVTVKNERRKPAPGPTDAGNVHARGPGALR